MSFVPNASPFIVFIVNFVGITSVLMISLTFRIGDIERTRRRAV